MAHHSIDIQLLKYFHSLAKPQQIDVLNYLKSMMNQNPQPKGELLKLAGVISSDDLAMMSRAIEDCEQIDHNEW